MCDDDDHLFDDQLFEDYLFDDHLPSHHRTKSPAVFRLLRIVSVVDKLVVDHRC